MPREKRFLVADHLGGLAKWLRLLGYDAAMYPRAGFHRLVARAMREKRIYLTRNAQEAADKRSFPRRLITADHPTEQLGELRDLLSLDPQRLFCRCNRCNTPLRELPAERAAQLAPPYIVATHKHIHYCPDCGRLYWPGTHEKAIRRTLQKIFCPASSA
ncbi:MAG: Mut7-C RNAse domain-containing protein [Candidatus Cloacimonetes bacterium]|nr:Mut7-C RNAse domain-containing protein [Candidatus Cloacimonadota bacterium]